MALLLSHGSINKYKNILTIQDNLQFSWTSMLLTSK